MSSHHIRYGIDLGTTNSAIARIHRGRVEILKNDFQSDTTPSAVSFAKRGVRVGQRSRNEWFREQFRNAGARKRGGSCVLEFKRTMGTDHRYSPTSQPRTGMLSEAISAEILKALLGFARLRSGEDPEAVVVTIPAAFQVLQQQATQKAAELAGVRQCHLLQEPVAAAMAFGLEAGSGTSVKWLVFDFGGGTFDAALVVSEEGQITVRDTEGDNRLGGKDLDEAIVDTLVLPEVEDQIPAGFSRDDRDFVRRGLRKSAEHARIELSTLESTFVETDLGEIRLGSGDELELDFELTRATLEPVVTPLFERAIGKAEALLARHGLSSDDLDDVILVGGPTHSPILREMLSLRLRPPNTSMDPMTAVARGAALYASTVALDSAIVAVTSQNRGADVLALKIEHETTSINETEFVTVKLRDPLDLRQHGAVEIELRREGWASVWEPLGPRGALFEALLEAGTPNTFTLSARTARGRSLRTDPSELTIIQGVQITGSPLANSLGVAALSQDRTRRVFRALEGAERSRTLPVTGVTSGLRTTAPLRPGTSDRLRLAIWEGDTESDGKRLVRCVGEVISLSLRGVELEETVPEGSPFRVEIETQDSSAVPVRAAVFFEALDAEYSLDIPEGKHFSASTEWVNEEVERAEWELTQLRDSSRFDPFELMDIEDRLSESAEKFRRSVDKRDTDGWAQALDRLKEALGELYDLVDSDEWARIETDIDSDWRNLSQGVDVASDPKLRHLAAEMRAVKERRDVRVGRRLQNKLREIYWERNRGRICRTLIAWAKRDFAQFRWKDIARARQEVDAAVRTVQAGGTEEQILHHCARIQPLVLRWPDGDPGFDPRDLPQL